MKTSTIFLLMAFFGGIASAAPIIFEAETAAEIEVPVYVVTATNVPAGTKFVGGASGDCYLEIPEKAGNPPKRNEGFAEYHVEIPAEGNYVLWARVFWEGECSNSFTVRIDGSAPFSFGEDATYNAWHWVKYPVARVAPLIKLAAGKHVIRFENREDGVRLDKIILADSKRFVPVD